MNVGKERQVSNSHDAAVVQSALSAMVPWSRRRGLHADVAHAVCWKIVRVGLLRHESARALNWRHPFLLTARSSNVMDLGQLTGSLSH